MDGAAALRKPIVIIGAPRSGTTLLYRVLSAHPDVVGFNEPRMIWRYGNDRRSDVLRAEDARPEVVRHIRNYFERHVAHAGGQRMLEKTPANSLRLPFVNRVFPDAKFVLLYRDGVDASLSAAQRWENRANDMGGRARHLLAQRARELGVRRLPVYAIELARRLAPASSLAVLGRNVWGPRLPGIRGMMRELTSAEIAALQWRTCVEFAYCDARTLPKDRYFEIRTEDMTPSLISRLLDFCELEDHSDVLSAYEYQQHTRRRQTGPHDPEQVAMVMKWIGSTMAWLDECEIG